MLISVVVPAYKKESTIISDITRLYKTLSETRFNFELIIVEDGKLDDTEKVFLAHLESSPDLAKKVTFVGYKTNKGKGYAVRYGMARAKGDYIAFIDAGMEIDPSGISILIEHMLWYSADIMVGSKRHPASKTNISNIRRIYSWGYYNLVKLMFGIQVTDTQTGLKVYKREVLEKVLPRLLVKEYAFDIELLAVARRLGYKRIFDAPVEIHLDVTSDSKITSFIFNKAIRSMLLDTCAVFYRLHILKYYDDESSRQWKFDEELMMRVNTGAMGVKAGASNLKSLSKNVKNVCRFSIIIPVRTINKHVVQNVINLQALPFKDYEVLIITDSEETNTFKDDRITLIASGAIVPGEKRNIGASQAKGEILVFLDDDAYPSSGWLTHADRLFREENIYALAGPAVTPKGVSFMERSCGRVLEAPITSGNTGHIHIPKTRRFVKDFPSVNLFVKRDVFYKVGGFNNEFWPGEDTLLCLNLVKETGSDILYDPAPIVYHHRRESFRPHLKQYSRYGQHRGQFARAYPETSRLPMYFFPSLLVLGLVLGPIFAQYYPPLWVVYLSTVVVYLGLIVYNSTQAALKDMNLFEFPIVAMGIFLTHVTYGIYFLIGLFKRPKFALKKLDTASGSYIGG